MYVSNHGDGLGYANGPATCNAYLKCEVERGRDRRLVHAGNAHPPPVQEQDFASPASFRHFIGNARFFGDAGKTRSVTCVTRSAVRFDPMKENSGRERRLPSAAAPTLVGCALYG